jgi:hypothetical protein
MEETARKERIEETTQEHERLERQRRTMERKANALQEKNSIFLMPAGGEAGWKMTAGIRDLDRALNNLKRRAGFALPVDEAMKKLSSIDATVNEVWDLVFECLPWTRAYKPEDWRKLNDSEEEKKRLAARRASTVIMPRDDRIGAIALGIKLLNGRIYELQAESRFEDLQRLADRYREISAALSQAAASLNNNANP